MGGLLSAEGGADDMLAPERWTYPAGAEPMNARGPTEADLARLHEWVDAAIACRAEHEARTLPSQGEGVAGGYASGDGSSTSTSTSTSSASSTSSCGGVWEGPRGFEVRRNAMGTGLYFPASSPDAPKKENLVPGAVYLRLPHELVMTADKARASPRIGAALREWEARCSSSGGLGLGMAPALIPDEPTVLILFLLSELGRGVDSPWHPYLAALPGDGAFKDLPFYWPPDALEELGGHIIVQEVGE